MVKIRIISIHAPREGGDYQAGPVVPQYRHFNPRPPRGGRRQIDAPCASARCISIHAPREGGDATPTGQAQRSPISIHAPREGGDWYSYPVEIDPRTISIHAPREGGDTTPIIMIARRI